MSENGFKQFESHCFFPTLNDEPREQRTNERHFQAVDLDHKLLEQETDLGWPLRLAWSVVLRLYTACDDIIFLYVDSGNQGTELRVCNFKLSDDAILSGSDINAKSQPHMWQWQLDENCDLRKKPFNTALVLEPNSGNESNKIQPMQCVDLQEGFDVILRVQGARGQARVVLDYDTSILCPDQAVSVAESFKLACGNLAGKKSFRLRDLNLCSAHDINQLSQWNPPAPEQQPICVHQAILNQCLQSPRSLAVECWDGNLTYSELDLLSAQLAQRLVSLGVVTETVVPLCFEKSKWAIVAVLGVMRAGGVYVFLDPSYPEARMRSICLDLQAKYLVCSTITSAIGDTLGMQTVALSDEQLPSNRNGCHQQVINGFITPQNAVYATFSSGSTGKPKGVVIEHGAFYLKAIANRQALSLSNQSRVLQFSNYVFDVSNRDILYTLMFGGCICMPSEFDRYHNLMAFMADKQINWASLTPSLVNLLEPSGVPHLRHLVLCGEPMTPRHIATWAAKVNLINAYGPCETVTISSVRSNASARFHHANIGHSSGSNIWIVDVNDYNKLLPIGAVGELVIESPSVGRGYIKNPTQTEASFLPFPAWLSHIRQNPGSKRVYRTGDIGRYESDGSIRFLGRKDTQVKIRGQRVELGEVEHQIQHILGREIDIPVVVDLITPQGLKSALLVAFLPIMQDAKALTKEALAALRKIVPGLEKRLSEFLPAYMIPSEFVIVEQIPMTATGKKNRRRLLETFATFIRDKLVSRQLSEKRIEAPSTEMEKRLQHIWASVLDMEACSIKLEDSFFRLGGDSITAMQVAALARSRTLDLSVADILEHKHLNRLAELLSKRPKIDVDIQFPPFSLVNPKAFDEIQPGLDKLGSRELIADIVPVTETQTWFLKQWSLSSFRLILSGEIDVDRLHAACQAVVAQHSSLRTFFTEFGDTVLQVVLKEVNPPFQIIHTNQPLETACQLVTDIDLQESPLSSNLPIKFTLITGPNKEHALMVRLSHAQYDGYSSPVLFRGISSAYNTCDRPGVSWSSMPYSHYVYACHRHRTEEAFDFWREHLRDSSITALSVRNFCKDARAVDVRQGASGRLPTPPQDLTVPTLINAAFSIVLSQMIQQGDVVFGVVMNTRDIALQGVETMLGSCININPFRVRLPPTQTLLELCQSLHDQYIHVSRHSYLDLPDIITNCTNWNRDTKLGFMINHLDGTQKPIPLTLDRVPCTSLSWTANISLIDQVLVRSVTTQDELKVQVLTSDRVMSAEGASTMARRLVDTAQILSECPDIFLSSLGSGI